MKEIESLVTERVEGAPDPEVRAYRPPRRYTAAYKQRILDEYERLDREGKGALLRREGLYNQLISVWRKQRDGGAVEALERPVGRPKSDPRTGSWPGCGPTSSGWRPSWPPPAR